MKKIHIILLLFISFINCEKDNPQESSGSILYFNGDIITMEGNSPVYAEVLVVKNKKMELRAMSKSDVFRARGNLPA